MNRWENGRSKPNLTAMKSIKSFCEENNLDLGFNKKILRKEDKLNEKEIEELSLALLAKMTLKEKIGQLVQSGTDCSAISGPSFDASKTVDDICNGMVGSILGTHDDRFSFNLQQKALSSRLGIPLIFCADIIHGCRTSFPINSDSKLKMLILKTLQEDSLRLKDMMNIEK